LAGLNPQTAQLTMYLTSDIKKNIFKTHGKSEKDTGSSEGQIALFTHRINHLTEHLKNKPKDKSTERSLVLMVGKRKALLDYLKKTDIERYRAILKKLEIRK
jgi:small subunit ribosomal protein S15